MPAAFHRHRPFRRLVTAPLAALVALCLTGAMVGCSSDDASKPKTAKEALKALNIGDSPDVVVATAVERLDPRTVLGPELGGTYLRLKYALEGFSWADAECAVDAARRIITTDVFDKMPISRMDAIAYDFPAVDGAVRACASPDSLARINAKADPTTTTIAGQPNPKAATDIDGKVVGDMSKAFYRLSAKALQLTEVETDCMIAAVLGDRSDADFAKLVTGALHSSVEATAPAVAKCLKAKRLDEVTPIAARSLLAQQAAARKERERVQALIQQQSAGTSAEVTVPPTGG